MSTKHFVVCLLALAGSGYIFLLRHRGMHGSSGLRAAAAVLPNKSVQKQAGRGASRNGARMQISRPVVSTRSENDSVRPSIAPVSIPMVLESNVGQSDSRVEFFGRGKGLTIFLMRNQIAVRAGTTGTVAIRFRTSSDKGEREPGNGNGDQRLAWQGEGGSYRARATISLETIRGCGARMCLISRVRRQRALRGDSTWPFTAPMKGSNTICASHRAQIFRS